MEEIRPGLYKVDIPIPKNPLKSLNCYILRSGERTFVVDTGFNLMECRQALMDSLDDLDVDLNNTTVFITHMHADHAGLVSDLVREGAQAICSREDADMINAGEAPFLMMDVFIRTGGFPAEELQNAVKKHPGLRYRAMEHVDFQIVNDGDTLTMGDYRFTCIKTPGHTRGHMCLYEEEKKILFSGDHVLASITPNISLWSDRFDPLQDYLASLDKIRSLDVELVLPGHRSLITDLKKRIDELKKHHELRANEVLEILRQSPQNAYEVAAKMTWDLTYANFERFPVAQKWFATGEALAHLKYLEGKNQAGRSEKEGIVLFHAKGGF
jgi:glyoxylase-like metal-dependent hydrolase (beta-lactamase superfamily II)